MTRLRPRSSRAAVTLAALTSIAACAHTQPEPTHYPALPPGPSASSATPAFEPDPSLVRAQLACRAEEPSLDNALDDDCDGVVDGGSRDDALVLALAYPRALPLTLLLRSEGGEDRELTLPACDAARAFCTARLDGATLPRGRHLLLARTGDAHARTAPLSLLIASQERGKVSTYLVPLAADDRERTLGRLSLP